MGDERLWMARVGLCPVSRGALEGQRGVSLVEVLVAVSLVMLFVAGAAGAVRSLWERWSLEQTAQMWISDMNAARYHAVAKSVVVTVCPSVDGEYCAPERGWAEGWIVFVDSDRDGRRAAPHEAMLRQRSSSRAWSRGRLRGTATLGRYVMYTPQGRPRMHTGAFQAGSLVVCEPEGRRGVRLVMNAAGRWRLEEMRAGECG